MTILKANAYGHGLVAVAQRLEQRRCVVSRRGVSRRRSAAAPARRAHAGAGDGRHRRLDRFPLFLEHDLDLDRILGRQAARDRECAAAFGRRARVHLKIDTGMERIGVHWYSAEQLLEAVDALPSTWMSKASSRTSPAPTSRTSARSRLQLERFQEVLRFYERRSLPAAAAPRRELGRDPATAGELFRHGAAGRVVLRRESRDRSCAHACRLRRRCAGSPLSCSSRSCEPAIR